MFQSFEAKTIAERLENLLLRLKRCGTLLTVVSPIADVQDFLLAIFPSST
jgi:hypothetical protein